MGTVSPGFKGRGRRREPSAELPPGQYLEERQVGPRDPAAGHRRAGAVGRCTACGRTGPLAEVRVFDHAPGAVARCPTCDQVLVRLVGDRGRAWLDLRGLSYLQLPVPNET
jgi:ribosomal protein S27E